MTKPTIVVKCPVNYCMIILSAYLRFWLLITSCFLFLQPDCFYIYVYSYIILQGQRDNQKQARVT